MPVVSSGFSMESKRRPIIEHPADQRRRILLAGPKSTEAGINCSLIFSKYNKEAL